MKRFHAPPRRPRRSSPEASLPRRRARSKPSANGVVQVPPSAPLGAPARQVLGARSRRSTSARSRRARRSSHDYEVENVGQGRPRDRQRPRQLRVHPRGRREDAARAGREDGHQREAEHDGQAGPDPDHDHGHDERHRRARPRSLTLSGRVAQPVRPSVTELNFGTLRKGTAVAPKTFEVLISGAQSITDIKTDNEQVKASTSRSRPRRRSRATASTVTLEGMLPVGQLRSHALDRDDRPGAEDRHDPGARPRRGRDRRQAPHVQLRQGQAPARPRRRSSRSRRPATPTSRSRDVQVKPEGAFTAKLEEVKAGKTYKIVLGIAPDAKEGYSRGTVSIKTNVPGETDLQVYFYALLQVARTRHADRTQTHGRRRHRRPRCLRRVRRDPGRGRGAGVAPVLRVRPRTARSSSSAATSTASSGRAAAASRRSAAFTAARTRSPS